MYFLLQSHLCILLSSAFLLGNLPIFTLHCTLEASTLLTGCYGTVKYTLLICTLETTKLYTADYKKRTMETTSLKATTLNIANYNSQAGFEGGHECDNPGLSAAKTKTNVVLYQVTKL